MSQPEQKTPLIAWVLLLTLSMIWGSSFILIKRGLIHLSSGQVGALRIVSAYFFLLPFAVNRLRTIKRSDWKILVVVGFIGSLIPSFLFAIAQTQIQSSLTGVLNALTPIFVILMGMLFFQHKYGSQTFYGVALGFLGTIILIISGSDGGISFNAYGLFIVLATILYAGNLNTIKHFLGHLRALTITSISISIVGPIPTIYLFFFTDFPSKLVAGGEVGLSIFYIVILGVLGTAIALIIFNHIVKLTNPVFTSSVTYIIPLVAITWGLADGEILTYMHVIGILAIISGVYIANRRRTQRSKTALKTQ